MGVRGWGQQGPPREQERARRGLVDPGTKAIYPLPHCSLVAVGSLSLAMHRRSVLATLEALCIRHLFGQAQNFVWSSKLVLIVGTISLSHMKRGRVAQRVRRE